MLRKWHWIVCGELAGGIVAVAASCCTLGRRFEVRASLMSHSRGMHSLHRTVQAVVEIVNMVHASAPVSCAALAYS